MREKMSRAWFGLILLILLTAWVVMRHLHIGPFDPAPFIALNLLLSLQAAFTGPVLQLSGNRQTNKIEDLVEAIQSAVAELVRSDELQEQLARNDAEVLAAILELVQQHRQPNTGR